MSVPDKSIDPRLLASAKAEFLDKGFIKAELKTICENAGITTGAVYKRYKSKEDLFCSVVDDIAEHLDLFVKKRSGQTFALLIDKAAGTRYESFNHDFVNKMSYAYEQYYAEAKKRSLAHAEVTREEFHVLLSAFWTCICEPFVHEMSWEQIEEHCRIICRFFNWQEVIMLKKGDENFV